MPSVTMRELSNWLSEFRQLDADSPEPSALDRTWDTEAVDTTLVLVLDTSHTDVLLQREAGGSPEWTVTFQAREWDSPATYGETLEMAHQIASVAHLCDYLTKKTAAHFDRVSRGFV